MRYPNGGNVKLIATIAILAAILSPAAICQDQKKLTRAEAMGAVVNRVEPEYPALARQLKISGSVELEALVAESGAVEKVTIVAGNPVLTKAGSEALSKWKFRPFVADGKPVKAIAPVVIEFR
jgi:periplasmic protein TonB